MGATSSTGAFCSRRVRPATSRGVWQPLGYARSRSMSRGLATKRRKHART